MKEVTKKQFANSAMWRLVETLSKKLVSVVISTMLARMISPEAYGVVALTTIFITCSDIFICSGFNVALIRKKEVTELDYSTVMIMSLVFSEVVYMIIFFAAPFLATFYNTPELCNVLRVITLLLFPQSISAVISSKATREMEIKKMSIISLIAGTAASIIAVIMAFNNFGVWALVAQQLLGNIFGMILLIIVFKWKFSFKYSFAAAKEMSSFTAGVLGASFLDFFANNVGGLFIGKIFSQAELGYLNRGNSYPDTVALNIYTSITGVLLPTLSSRQDDKEAMKNVTRKVISVTEYIIMPLMFGMIAVVDGFITVLLTDKWMPCLWIIVIGCIYHVLNPIRAIGGNVFSACGDSKKNVIMETYRTIMSMTNLVVTTIILRKSIYVSSAIGLVIALVIVILTSIQLNKMIGYNCKELLSDIFPSLAMSLIMLIIVRAMTLINMNNVVLFVLQIAVGGLVYIVLSIVTKNKNFHYLLDYVLKLVKQKVTGIEENE